VKSQEGSIFMIPEESAYENYPVPVPELVHIAAMDVNVEMREIFVNGEIDEDFGPWFTTVMCYLQKNDDRRPITIWLNTPGGSETSMFSFHDAVRTSHCIVTVIGTGQVVSAGVLMLACGDRRLVTESCVLMCHRGKSSFDGDLETAEARLQYTKWSEQHWARLMDRYTPDEVDGRVRDVKYWFDLGKKKAEWWLLGGDAIVKEGIASAVLTHSSQLAPEPAE
jgi:ATP-dependent protease ClpP protease subunit